MASSYAVAGQASATLDSDGFIERLSKLPLEFAPGQGWNYSVATDVLGIAVERISGMRLGDYFAKHIFAPLGMADTGFGVAEGQSERLVDAYAYRPGQAPRRWSGMLSRCPFGHAVGFTPTRHNFSFDPTYLQGSPLGVDLLW